MEGAQPNGQKQGFQPQQSQQAPPPPPQQQQPRQQQQYQQRYNPATPSSPTPYSAPNEG